MQKSSWMESIADGGKSREETLTQKSAWPVLGSARRPVGLCVLFSQFRAMPAIWAACNDK